MLTSAGREECASCPPLMTTRTQPNSGGKVLPPLSFEQDRRPHSRSAPASSGPDVNFTGPHPCVLVPMSTILGDIAPVFGVSRALPTRKETTSTMSSGLPLLAIVALPFHWEPHCHLPAPECQERCCLPGRVCGPVRHRPDGPPVPSRWPWRRPARRHRVGCPLWASTSACAWTASPGCSRMLVTRHRLAGRALRALLHVARGSGAALLRVPARVHGRDARHRAVRQPDPAGRSSGS